MTGIWGKKIGMTQVFDENKVVPVTVVEASHWYVTNVRTHERDGYSAVQVGCVKPRFRDQAFSADWIKKPNEFFSYVREVRLDEDPNAEHFAIGSLVEVSALQEGEKVDAFGVSIGRGFSGVMRRHNFSGPPASHGSRMGRRPGSIGGPRTQGKVLKGKKMPGHFGAENKAIRGLRVVSVKPEEHVVLIKGSVPGKVGSLVFLRKA